METARLIALHLEQTVPRKEQQEYSKNEKIRKMANLREPFQGYILEGAVRQRPANSNRQDSRVKL